MSKSNLAETSTLELIFQNIAFSNIGDAGGLLPSVAPGNLYIALYTTDPTEADAGTEATFTGYARVAVVRSAVGWTVAGDVCSNAALITFPTATGGSETITHFAIRTAATLGDMLFHSPVTTPRLVNSGVTVEFAIGALTITES